MAQNIQFPTHTGIPEVDKALRILKTKISKVLTWNAMGPPRAITTNTTIDATYGIINVDASAAAVTVTLPKASTHKGKHFNIKKTDSSGNTVTIDGNAAETIDGATTQVISTQWDAVTIYCDGTGWFIK